MFGLEEWESGSLSENVWTRILEVGACNQSEAKVDGSLVDRFKYDEDVGSSG